MDLKGPTGLDPKLKETYERVMGTSFIPPATGPQGQPQVQPQLKTEEVKQEAPTIILPNIQAPLQPPPVQPLTEQHPLAAAEQPLPAAPLPPINSAPEPQPEVPQMVQSPQVFTQVNPFQETSVPPGEVLANNAVVATDKKSNKMVVAGLLVGGIIFFIVYAFIWAKVFGLF